MVTTIFKYEWKQFIRIRGLVAALLVFAAIGFFCLHQGKAVYQFQQVSADSALTKKQRNFDKVKSIFDTLQTSGKEPHELEDPFYLDWRLQDVAVRRINPLSILSIGQSDIYTPLLSARVTTPIFKNDFAEFQNPEKLLAGNLDLSYFLLFLFPLIFIALSYNIQSSDRETGITPILAVQATSINQVIYGRLLFRWLLAMLPLFTIAIVSFIQLSAFNHFNAPAWLQWWGVALLYAAFWLLVVAFVQRFRFSSLINAITLAGIWVLLLIAIPGLLNTWFNYQYPSTNKTEVAEYRDYDVKAWDKPFNEHKAFMFQRYPAYSKLDLSKEEDSVNFRSFSYVLMSYEKERELYKQMAKEKMDQAAVEEKSFWLNPVGGVMRSLATISQASLKQQQQFEEAVLNYREKKIKYLFEKMVTQLHFTKKDFEGIPKYENPSGNSKHLFLYLLPVLLLIVVLFVATAFTNKKML
jgi:ABC-2 type transport system permease protein